MQSTQVAKQEAWRMEAAIVSVNVGVAQPLAMRGREVASGIFKLPIAGPVALNVEGLAGDVQVDRRYHGGPDKALNVYPSEHLAYWSARLERSLEPGAFGENLTTRGWDEETVCIGDVYRVGQVRLQVTQPRQPCSKLAAKHALPMFVKWVQESGKTGFYLRVLQPGMIAAGEALVLEERPAHAVTIAAANYALVHPSDRAATERLLAVPALSADWRKDLQRRLE